MAICPFRQSGRTAPSRRSGIKPSRRGPLLSFIAITTSLLGGGVSVLFRAVGVGSTFCSEQVERHGGMADLDHSTYTTDELITQAAGGAADYWHLHLGDFSDFAPEGVESSLSGAVAAECAQHLLARGANFPCEAPPHRNRGSSLWETPAWLSPPSSESLPDQDVRRRSASLAGIHQRGLPFPARARQPPLSEYLCSARESPF